MPSSPVFAILSVTWADVLVLQVSPHVKLKPFQRSITHSEAVSGAILTNILHSGLKERFSWGVISQLTSFTFFLSNSCLPSSDDDKSLIIGVYARGLHAVFISFAVLTGIMLVACLCLRDYGLKIKRTIQP